MRATGAFLCIHGHFYQPPRENPWTGRIETQPSASPHPDWNERVHQECYGPNTRARILDAHGRTTSTVNNFERISFNIGPTLLSWLEQSHPDAYRRILEADRKSRARHHGHGNALAQVYGHVIMPLANHRDQYTQVRWGLADFRHRFGREPEAIWLPETACDGATLDVLIDCGMRFVILAPHQAQAVRPFSGGPWLDVSAGRINPRQAYRCYSTRDSKRFIDVLFYDGPISHAVSFEDLLGDAKRWMDRIESARAPGGDPHALIATATDGETFGHHKAHGERGLAYLLFIEAPRREWQIVNFAEFLELHPPQWEVRLVGAEDGSATSWSCPHGVRRWTDDCGCRAGGPPEWTQAWRRPMRVALDRLRDELAVLFEKEASAYVSDAWKARDDYIAVVLDRSETRVWAFFKAHAKRCLSAAEHSACLKLLEMQRYCLLMYTSCGWFFNDISGLESVQILQYAARAAQLADEVVGRPAYEDRLVTGLAAAPSNVPEYGDGEGVYEALVRPRQVSARV